MAPRPHILCRRLNQSPEDPLLRLNSYGFLDKSKSVFIMGSCFGSIEIKGYLIERGYNVLNREMKCGGEEVDVWYNSETIRYEFDRLVGDFEQNDTWFVEKTGLHQDPYRRCLFADSAKNLRKLIASTDAQMHKSLRSCDCLIITLTLCEIFRQNSNDMAICSVPGYPKGRGGGQDSYLDRLSYQNNVLNLQKIVDIMHSINQSCNIILAVCPVPMAVTYSRKDHIVANFEGKAILRSAIAEVENRYSNVYYFPAYEIASSYKKDQVYKKDARHLTPEFVRKIMSKFEQSFVS